MKAIFYLKRKQALKVGGRSSEFKEMRCIKSITETFKRGKANALQIKT